jgi:hypothetical protein
LFADCERTQPPIIRFAVGVAGSEYPGYKMVSLEDFRTNLASELLRAHRVQGGFPIFGRLKFKAVLRVAEGSVPFVRVQSYSVGLINNNLCQSMNFCVCMRPTLCPGDFVWVETG